MRQSSLSDEPNLLVHLFCPPSSLSHSAADDQELFREATNLITCCSTRPAPQIRVGSFGDGRKPSTLEWVNPSARSNRLTAKDLKGRATSALPAYEYSVPPPPHNIDLAVEPSSSFLRDEYLCPPGEEDLYLPRKRRKIDISAHTPRRRRADLREWGASTSPWTGDVDIVEADQEVYRINDLDEFESTDFTYITTAQVGSEAKERVGKTKDTPLPQPQLQVTSPIFGPDSLYELIPQPHFHKSLVSHHGQSTKKPRDPSLPPYQKSRPQYLTPYAPLTTSPSLSPPFSDHYARTAWIVPIRGRFTGPFLQTTSAILRFPSNSTTELPPRLDPGRNEMQWSPSSLVSFWNFLLQVREARQVGSIGISLHLGVPEHLPLGSDTVGVPINFALRLSQECSSPAIIGSFEGGAASSNVSLSGHANVQTGAEARNGTLSLQQDDEQLGQPRSWFCSSTSNTSLVSGDRHSIRAANSTLQQEPMIRSMELGATPYPDVLDCSAGQKEEQDPSCLLARMDYIKVYHEARHAFVLRNVLHLWGYTPAPPAPAPSPANAMDVDPEITVGNAAAKAMGAGHRGGDEHENTLGKGKEAREKGGKKVRLLKGAKLLLVDSRSKGVLIL